MIMNGTEYSGQRSLMKQSIYRREEIKKDGPCYADNPGVLANRWKGTPQAHNRIYPSLFILLSKELLHVNKMIVKVAIFLIGRIPGLPGNEWLSCSERISCSN